MIVYSFFDFCVDEFVAAGDFLSYKFPTWQWCAGDASKAREYLPKNKQFLISRGVPSLRRVSEIEGGAGGPLREDEEKLMSFDEAGSEGQDVDPWVATHFDSQASSSSRAVDITDIPDIGEESTAPEHQLTEGQENDLAARVAGVNLDGSTDNTDANEVGDMPDMEEIQDIDDETDELGAGIEEEDDPATATSTQFATSRSGLAISSSSNKLLSVRKYDCIITYDKYYQTPRMWLVGYDEHGVPLKPAQIFEDVSSDYAQKTVTIEPFPHGHAGPDGSAPSNATGAGVATASIHPCKHASVMKKVIERMNVSVIEEQRKAAVGTNAGDKKKRKGWSVTGAVRKVTGSSSKEQEANTASSASTDPDSEEGIADVEGLRVDQYMIIFLKFMASIVPAIEIDATQAL